MSYILDALRKADAQRERDPARGIHAQPLRGNLGKPGSGGGYGPWFWSAAVVGLAALASGGWYLFRDGGPAQAVPPAHVDARSSMAQVVAVAPQLAPVIGTTVQPPPAAVVAQAPATTIEPPPLRRVQAPAMYPRDTSQPTMRGGPQQGPSVAPPAGTPAPGAVPPASPQLPAATMPVPTAPAAASPQAGVPPAATGAPVNPTPAMVPQPGVPVTPRAPLPPAPPPPPAQPVAGLPADAPKVVISGGVYSANPAHRMLIANGQVINEGSEVGPGLVLEEIRSKTAVLRFRGSRYTVGY
jgi:general secretion pathway protein B